MKTINQAETYKIIILIAMYKCKKHTTYGINRRLEGFGFFIPLSQLLDYLNDAVASGLLEIRPPSIKNGLKEYHFTEKGIVFITHHPIFDNVVFITAFLYAEFAICGPDIEETQTYKVALLMLVCCLEVRELPAILKALRQIYYLPVEDAQEKLEHAAQEKLLQKKKIFVESFYPTQQGKKFLINHPLYNHFMAVINFTYSA